MAILWKTKTKLQIKQERVPGREHHDGPNPVSLAERQPGLERLALSGVQGSRFLKVLQVTSDVGDVIRLTTRGKYPILVAKMRQAITVEAYRRAPTPTRREMSEHPSEGAQCLLASLLAEPIPGDVVRAAISIENLDRHIPFEVFVMGSVDHTQRSLANLLV